MSPVCLVTQARIDRAVEAQAPSEVKSPDKKHRENSQGACLLYAYPVVSLGEIMILGLYLPALLL
jgi:hypothetical protein